MNYVKIYQYIYIEYTYIYIYIHILLSSLINFLKLMILGPSNLIPAPAGRRKPRLHWLQ